MSYTEVFGGSTIEGARVGYRAVALSANTSLRWPNIAENSTDVAADEMDVTATGAGFELALPDATQVSTGRALFIANVGSDSFDLTDSTGSTIVTIAASVQYIIYLRDNSTAAGTWRAIQLGATTSVAQASSLESATIKNISGSLNIAAPIVAKATAYTVAVSDRGKLIVWSGGSDTITLLPVSGNTDFFFYVRNAGSGTLTLDGASAETIDGTATVALASGEACIVFCDGSAWYTVGQGRSVTFSATRLSLVLSATTTTLTSAQAANLLQDYTGSATQALEVIVPGSVAQYYVANLTTGTGTVTVKTATGSGVSMANGAHKILKCDGSTVYEAVSANAGTVTQIALATGLNGGPITGTGTIAVDNPFDVSGQIFTVGPGTATAPAFSFNGRAMMGLSSPAAGVVQISYSTSGGSVVTFASSGNVGIGATGPANKLSVGGGVSATGLLSIGGTASVGGAASFAAAVSITGTASVGLGAAFASNVVVAGTASVGGAAAFATNVVVVADVSALTHTATGSGAGFRFNDGTLATGVATATDMEAATATSQLVTPAQVHRHPGVAKAWCKFSTASGAVTLDRQHNVSSITDNGVGDFTINWAVTFSDAHYALALSGRNPSGQTFSAMENQDNPARTTTAVRVYSLNLSGAPTDPAVYSAIAFGDL
jgi:hypothetical protein